MGDRCPDFIEKERIGSYDCEQEKCECGDSGSKSCHKKQSGERRTMFLNYINNAWKLHAWEDDRYFESRNPATLESLGRFPLSDKKIVNEAVIAAKQAQPKWSEVPAPKRAEILFRAGKILEERKEEFSNLVTMEMGKVLKEARGDVQEAIDMTYFIAGEGRRLHGQTTPSEMPNKLAMTFREPVGVCAIITPWNFPFAIPAWKIMPALVCGNTVVFKPAEDTPLCATKLVEVLLEAGMKDYPGVLNLIYGFGEETGRALVRHPQVDLVSFTGSSATGREIAMICAAYYKKCSLEMGGKNPIIVMDDADLDLAIEGVIWGAFGTSGQRCTAASRVIVHKDIIPEFTEKLKKQTMKLKIGYGLNEEVDVGPLINEAALNKVENYIKIGIREGAEVICGNWRPAVYGNQHIVNLPGWFIAPTIFTGVKPNMRIAQEEIFGPVTCILECESFEHAIEIANDAQYGLSSAIYTKDISKAMRAIRNLKSGIVYINGSTIGAETHLPFGGVKRTGNGHREGLHVLDIFTEWKTVYIDYSGKLQKAQIDNN